MHYQHKPLDDHTCYRLAPWCYQWEDGIYHDFLAAHTPMTRLRLLLRKYPHGFTVADAEQVGETAVSIDNWYRQGYVTFI